VSELRRARQGRFDDRFGTYHHSSRYCCSVTPLQVMMMNGLIYLIGLVVVIMFILSFLGLR
jgi:hypothetical protein